MERTRTLLQPLQFSSSKMCLLHLTETRPGSSALASLVRNSHRQGSFNDGNLLSQLWRLEGWEQGGGVLVRTLLPGPSHGGVQGRHRREQLSPASSHKGVNPSTGLFPNDFTQPHWFPKGPHLLTPSHWSQEESRGGPGHRRLSVSHFPVCREQNAASRTSPWVSKGRFQQLPIKEGATKNLPEAKWKRAEGLIRALVQSLSRGWRFATPRTAARHASLSFTISQSLLKLMSVGSVMPSNHLILCHPLLHLPSIFLSIRVFSNKSVLHIRWPKYWSFGFSISPSKKIQGWFPLGLTGLLSLLCKGLSRGFSSTTVWKHQFFSA